MSYERGRDGGRSYSPRRRSPDRRGRSRSPPRSGGGGRRDDSPGRNEPTGTSMMVRNLSKTTRPEDLRYACEKYGPVRDVYLPRDYYTGQPRGIGFVEFADHRDCRDAIRYMDGFMIDGRRVGCNLALHGRRRPEDMKTRDDVPPPRGGGRSGRSRSRSRGRDRVRSRSRDRSRSRGRSADRSRGRDRGRSPAAPARSRSPRDEPKRRSVSRSPVRRDRSLSRSPVRERSASPLPMERGSPPPRSESPPLDGDRSPTPARGRSPDRE